jgi:hypothetical protein
MQEAEGKHQDAKGREDQDGRNGRVSRLAHHGVHRQVWIQLQQLGH